MRLLSWNIGGRDLYSELLKSNADIALLQEARKPNQLPSPQVLPSAEEDWRTEGSRNRDWSTAIVGLNLEYSLRALRAAPVGYETDGDFCVSRRGTIQIAEVSRNDTVLLNVACVYSPWERPSAKNSPIFADTSAHRILSDLAQFMSGTKKTPLMVAGDFNILRGYGEGGSGHWKRRYASVFDRAEAIGLHFVGPEFPNGVQADPWPDELPKDSLNVPTFRTDPLDSSTAQRQLDFVFCSKRLVGTTSVRALNEASEWGPSDHCQISIEVDL